jgi:AraC-like DNA-binding protein
MLDSDHAAVTAYERHIIATEGPRTVAGTFYPREIDAAEQRHWLAERMVREAHRQEAIGRAVTSAPRARVGTWLSVGERSRVEAAAGAHATFSHRESLHAVRGDLTMGRIDAVLVSAAVVRLPDASTLSALVHDFPGTPVVGLVAEVNESEALARALIFGLAGVRVLVDARSAAGWAALRSTLDARHLPNAFAQWAVRTLTSGQATGSVTGAPGWARFLAAVFSPGVTRAEQLATSLGVCPSTLTSRFYRAGLPSPKKYIAYARLVWAARLAESPGLPISAIAHQLDASSPQSFGRTVRTFTGMTAGTFRQRYDGEGMLARFRVELIEPYRDTLRTFDPFDVSRAENGSAKRSSRRTLAVAGRAA